MPRMLHRAFPPPIQALRLTNLTISLPYINL